MALGNLEGKVVVDCTNAIGKGFTLVHGHTASSAEEIAKALPGAKVVRSFNQQGAEVLRNPTFGGRPATNFVAGDDAGARSIVRALSNDVGLDSVEAGPLSSARYLEPMTILWVAVSQAIGTREFGLSLLRR
jgi:predicted dinucleotide-binding enzyme